MSTKKTSRHSTSSTDSLDGRFQELIDLTKQLNTIELSDSEDSPETPTSSLGAQASARSAAPVEVVDLTGPDLPVVRKEYLDSYAAGNLVAPSLLRSRGWRRPQPQTSRSTVLVTSWQAPPQPTPREIPFIKKRSPSSGGTRAVNLTRNSDKQILASIVSTLDQHFRAELRKEPTPEKLNISLKAYQQMGLHWLLTQERSQIKGGILGDDMGLGKTVQIISLLLSSKFPRQPSSSATRGPTLVVVPKVVMGHWEEEICNKCHADSLTVWQYYGHRKKPASALKRYDVVLVTYQTLGLEYKRNLDSSTRSPLLEVTWQRVVLDEAHFIKNRQSSLSKACSELSATYRWCVTGTPVQNEIIELYPYLKFLRYPHTGLTLPMFRKLFGIANDQILNPQHIHSTLKAIFLRRTKAFVFGESGTEKLPPKTVQTHGLDFWTAEQSLYQSLEAQVKMAVQQAKTHGKKGGLPFYVEYITLLRQLCNHQGLLPLKHLATLPTVISFSDSSQWVKYLTQCPAITLRELARPNGEPSNPCPTCAKFPMQSPVLFSPCGHVHCFECACGWAQAMKKPSLRCKHCCNRSSYPHRGLPWELAKVFSTLLSKHNDRQTHNGVNTKSCTALEDELASLSLDPTAKYKTYCKSGSSQARCSGLGKSSVTDIGVGRDSRTPDSSSLDRMNAKSQTSYRTASTLTGKVGDVDRAIQSIRGSLRYRYYCTLFQDAVPCIKIDFLLSLLDTIITKHPDDKLVVFSQYVTFLKILEACLNKLDIRSQMYYGELTLSQRANILKTFNQTSASECRILLASTKACGTGLNLTVANHAILMDMWWNPSVDHQAMDRVYRIGQNKPVSVHRLFVADTIEERLLKIQVRKERLVNQYFQGQQKVTLTNADAEYLLRL
ncbi:hypothetical protein IWQ62_002934 [Dispira parvispora]|uniref:Uncharacterized protein n=1 Tax=Dispira parvispora TaxID=1520584 RepID=A0A9W8AVR6_9FUNG|nr:hypothetical protein IWQ62_002934 [Dispira parvispora]